MRELERIANERLEEIRRLRRVVSNWQGRCAELTQLRNGMGSEIIKLRQEVKELSNFKERTESFRELLFEFVMEGQEAPERS